MGSCSCTRRHFLLSTCFLQMITIIERQVFDFLGYMWAPILVNFFQILFIIFGFYGAYHFRIKYIITYLLWNFVWIGWNAFLICFYLNVGSLDRDSDLLNMGTGSVSWFEANGYGCKPTYNITSDDPYRPLRPERVEDCLLDYPLVEVIHSGAQCALALLGILGAILISCIFLDEDDRFDFMNGDAKSPQHTVVHPMYVSYTSIPTTSASATMQSNKQTQTQTQSQSQQQQQQYSLQFYHQHRHKSSNHNYNNNNNNNSNNNSYNNTLNQPQPQPQPDTANNPHLTHTSGSNKSQTRHQPHPQQPPPNESQQRRRLYQSRSPALNSVSPMSVSAQTTPSLSYASLQNSNPQLSNSNYSIFHAAVDNSGSGHFARIHHKPKAPKSLPDVKHTQLALARLSRNLEEDEDSFSLPHLSPDGVSYVPFQSPTPENNNLAFGSVQEPQIPSSPNNNHYTSYEQHVGLLGYSPKLLRGVPRPTQIALPTVPVHNCDHVEPPLETALSLSLSPPPAPRPHIFQPRLGQAPYPDLSPEIAEKYAMPTQHVSAAGSPMVRRSQRRPRPHPAPANFCDQIRDTPPGYMVRTHSDDQLEEQLQQQAAPHVNRRSGRKARPRSFCNSIVGSQA
ncbi:sodium/potassium-transporting ATPase subunit beta-1-interacting protein isoform X1 [Drosophila virilis]|uniref:Sodium/potassium-transporting ATPase subunit beta-1-interacting protein n=1 Tax=Drosophila virilis TaxID=7244 RepID=B4MEB6_DROVI|nr:sodium/potassium-transporting ATPase subunit beta-1-interacting protein isoform X1 [Drosophila virilis]EDW58881.1 uncharacterized protein Dvir_GJ18916, isoform A [Drosophila virilis]